MQNNKITFQYETQTVLKLMKKVITSSTLSLLNFRPQIIIKPHVTLILKEVDLDLVVPAKNFDFDNLCVLSLDLLEKPDVNLVIVTLMTFLLLRTLV